MIRPVKMAVEIHQPCRVPAASELPAGRAVVIQQIEGNTGGEKAARVAV